MHFGAEAIAGGASTKRAVEAENPRLDLIEREAGDRAGEFGGESDQSRVARVE